MSELLPVLRTDTPQMALCSVCPEPGHCCHGFTLTTADGGPTFWKDSWQADALEWAQQRVTPFLPERIISEHAADDGRAYVAIKFTCPKLTPTGRCSIYETRPHACRNFQPGNGGLCVFGEPQP